MAKFSPRVANGRLRCERCKTSFASPPYLKGHLKKNRCFFRRSQRDRFECPFCPAKFVARHTVEKHMKRLHSGNQSHFAFRIFPCEACPFVGRSRDEISAHRREHAKNAILAFAGGQAREEETSAHKFHPIKTAHNMKMAQFRYFFPENVGFMHVAFSHILPFLTTFLRETLAAKGGKNLKVSLVIQCEMVQINGFGEIVDSLDVPFRSALDVIRSPSEIVPFIMSAFGQMENSLEAFLTRGSGWALNDLYHFDVELYSVPPLVGACSLHEVSRRGKGVAMSNPPLSFPRGKDDGQDLRLQNCFYLAVARAALGPVLGKTAAHVRLYIQSVLNRFEKGGKSRFMLEKDVGAFEDAHDHLNFAINVVFENEEGQIFPLRASPRTTREGVLNILLLLSYFDSGPEAAAVGAHGGDGDDDSRVDIGHYSFVEDKEAFLGRRGKDREGRSISRKLHVCYNCMTTYFRASTYEAHVRWCHQKSGQVVKMPRRKERVEFSAFEKTFLTAFSVAYDFETYGLETARPCSCSEASRKHLTDEEKEDLNILLAEKLVKKKDLPKPCHHKTQVLTEQRAFAYSYVVFDRHGTVVEMSSYAGDDAAAVFVRKLFELEERYLTFLQNGGVAMSAEAEAEAGRPPPPFAKCHICGKALGNAPVRDHDHVSGDFVGWAHNSCNLRRRENLRLPVLAHNASGFDSHLIMKELSKLKNDDIDIQAIPLSTQKFKCLYINRMILMDSTSFLPFSLDVLSATLRKSNHPFPLLRQWERLAPRQKEDEEQYAAKAQEKLECVTRKGVFCYDYVRGGAEQLAEETSLPPKEAFFNVITQSHITDEEYSFAGRVFDLFECSSLLEYCIIYMEVDVLLLAEAVVNMRNILYREFGLDMMQYLSMPMMSRDLFLKSTGVSLELISDYDMILMLQRGLRGGVSFIGQRLAELDAQPPPPTDTAGLDNFYTTRKGSKEKESIIYVDANNLYGTSMLRALPFDDYRWMTEEELAAFDPVKHVLDDFEEGQGYILEVDLSYPEHLHLAHHSFPLAPEQQDIAAEDLSPYSWEVLSALKGASASKHKSRKLTATFRERKNYVVHGANLKYYVQKGMKIKAIHRGITFRQKRFLQGFIEMCTRKRRNALTKAESDLWKLVVNSLYGKSIENTDKRMDCRFNFGGRMVDQRLRCPSFKGAVICDENLSVTFHRKREVRMVQFWAWGFSVLDLSKLIMQRLFYDVIRPAFSNKVSVLMSDTDSFCLLIGQTPVNAALASIAPWMDFSNYDEGHPLFDASRKNELGLLKNETPGNLPIVRFAGVKPKSYALVTMGDSATGQGGVLHNRAKGVKKGVQKCLTFGDYKRTVLGASNVNVVQYGLQAKDYVNRVLRTEKVAFSSFYDQRYALCAIHTCPYGSVLIEMSSQLSGQCPICHYNIYL